MQDKVLWPGWETVRQIGKGGFGAVYEIRRDLFGSVEASALKVISIPQSDGELDRLRDDNYDELTIQNMYKQHMQSIVGEYSVMRKLNSCPNVVSCDDVRYEPHPDGIGWDIFIRMELLTPLAKAFPGTVTDQLVIKVGKEIANALVMCSRHHLLHRDIKPQNIFISDSGDFKLGDFGIAKAVEQTTGGTKTGTYGFMAPEVYNNQPYGMAADLYSLGLVLYWMLNERRMPFLPLPPAVPSFQDEEQAKLRRFRGEQLPEPKNGSAALKAVVMKACAYHPAQRYGSAAELLAALERVEQQQANWEPQRQETQQPAPKTDDPELTQAVRKALQDPNATVWVRPAKNDEAEQAEPKISHKPQENTKPKKGKPWLWILAVALILGAICGGLLNKWYPKQYPEQYTPLSLTWEEAAVRDTISAGEHHTVGLKADGTLVATGWNGSGQCDVASWTDIVAISAGDYHTVGLKANGTVVAVGSNFYGQCNVEDWTDIVAISAGDGRTVGLKADGTVVAVGDNDDGQCNVASWTDIVAISAGDFHTVGLQSDGTVEATGWNDYGRCDVASWTGIVAISAGNGHTVGLHSDGTMVATGWNEFGQCDVGSWTDIVAISAGTLHTVGLKADGTVVATGANDYGRCDVSDWTNIKVN